MIQLREDYKKVIAERLKKQMESLSISPSLLSELTGLSPGALSQILRGTRDGKHNGLNIKNLLIIYTELKRVKPSLRLGQLLGGLAE